MPWAVVKPCDSCGDHKGAMDKEEPKITCRRCGTCCLADFAAMKSSEERERWEKEGRRDILDILEHEHAVWMGDHLVSSEDGHYLHGCPFLAWEGDRSSCSIYETRPRVCRNYEPASSEICPQFKSCPELFAANKSNPGRSR